MEYPQLYMFFFAVQLTVACVTKLDSNWMHIP